MAFFLWSLVEKFYDAIIIIIIIFAIAWKREFNKQRKTIINVISEPVQLETKGFPHIQPHYSD